TKTWTGPIGIWWQLYHLYLPGWASSLVSGSRTYEDKHLPDSAVFETLGCIQKNSHRVCFDPPVRVLRSCPATSFRVSFLKFASANPQVHMFHDPLLDFVYLHASAFREFFSHGFLPYQPILSVS